MFEYENKIYYFPLEENYITLTYGMNKPVHLGYDINNKYKYRALNKPVYSVSDNLKVVEVAYSDSDRYGNYVILYDEDTISYFLFAHLNLIKVELNQVVDHNTVIGTVGLSGWCNPKNTGHLHFEIRKTFNMRRCAVPINGIELNKLYKREDDLN